MKGISLPADSMSFFDSGLKGWRQYAVASRERKEVHVSQICTDSVPAHGTFVVMTFSSF